MTSVSEEKLVDFYALLGISKSASSAEIEAACLRLGDTLRSTGTADSENANAEQFALVEKAFETLTNPATRLEYDRRLDAIVSDTDASDEAPPPPHKREGILVMAASVAVAAIAITAAVVMIGPTPLGVASIVGLTTFRFLPYESQSGYTYYTTHLIELDATIVLLLCFLVFLYGLLVFLAVLPRPSFIWRRLSRLWSKIAL